jgi:hypothetical protein
MVYLRQPKLSSQIINITQWKFLRMCDGRTLEDLKALAPSNLGFDVTIEQLQSTVEYLAGLGLLEGTKGLSNYHRVIDASPLIKRLSPIVRIATTQAFGWLTLGALVASIGLIINDWHRFVDQVALAARERPLSSILLYYLTFIPIALVHELGHSIVVNYYGGEVPEIVIRNNAHFAVLSNTTVLKERRQLLWYLSMGTVVDIYVWLALLIAFHYSGRYLLLMFLLPQMIYFLIYSYSIFNNSDYLKIIATRLHQPVPRQPWTFVRTGWQKLPEAKGARQLLYIMTASLALKFVLTAFLIWTFLIKEYRVLILYVVYRAIIYSVGHWREWISRMSLQKPVSFSKVTVRD